MIVQIEENGNSLKAWKVCLLGFLPLSNHFPAIGNYYSPINAKSLFHSEMGKVTIFIFITLKYFLTEYNHVEAAVGGHLFTSPSGTSEFKEKET